MRKTPYVVSIRPAVQKSIEGSTGYWGKFPDPFDPSFRQVASSPDGRRTQHKSADDPWCIGYFVDNELAWGDEVVAGRGGACPRPHRRPPSRSSWRT